MDIFQPPDLPQPTRVLVSGLLDGLDLRVQLILFCLGLLTLALTLQTTGCCLFVCCFIVVVVVVVVCVCEEKSGEGFSEALSSRLNSEIQFINENTNHKLPT